MRDAKHAGCRTIMLGPALLFFLQAYPPRPIEAAETAWQIVVHRDGMHRLTRSRLQAAGADTAAVDPASLILSNKGREVPLFVRGGDDGRFDPGDEIIFYGERHRDPSRENGLDRYTDDNVYRLTRGGRPGLRMARRSAFPPGSDRQAPEQRVFLERAHFEKNDHVFGLAFARENSGPGFEEVAGGVLQRVEGGYRLPPLPSDSWFWTPLNSTGRHSHAIHLPGLAQAGPKDEPYQARLRVALRGLTDQPQTPDHRTRILLDGGALLEDALWDGQSAHRFVSAPLPQTLLREGRNRVHIEKLPAAAAAPYRLLLNWIAVDYWRELSAQNDTLHFSLSGAGPAAVSGFSRPDIEIYAADGARYADLDIRPEGPAPRAWSARFLPRADQAPDGSRDYVALTRDRFLEPKAVRRDQPSRLRSRGQGADYLVIAHAGLLDGARALADHRRARGLATRVVDVQDIYDEFNHGVFDPQAIRAFLAYARARWTPAPYYVLLIGDADLDYRSGRNLTPSLQVQTRRYGAAAGDNRFVAFDVAAAPQMSIGRLPAANPDELARMVARILAYEQAPPPGPWRRRALMVAAGGARTGSVFIRQTEALIRDRLHPAFEPQRIYSTDAPDLTPALRNFVGGRDEVDAGFARGAALAIYLGHGAGGLWANGDTLLNSEAVRGLAGGGRLPFVLSMTCLTAAFDSGRRRSLGEEMLLAENGGAIAFFGSTSNSWVQDQFILLDEILISLSDKGVRTIGQAVLDAKRRFLARYPGGVGLVETFTLLGDPALEPALPRPVVELAVAPEAAAPGGALAVSGRVGQDAFAGQVEIALFEDGAARVEVDEDGGMIRFFEDRFPQRRRLGRQVAAVQDGRFQAEFALPPDALPGQAAVAAYAWNDRAAAIGRAKFTVTASGEGPWSKAPAPETSAAAAAESAASAGFDAAPPGSDSRAARAVSEPFLP